MDDLENWSSLMRAIAMEGRCFVITTTQYMKSSAYPIGHPVRKEHGDDKVLFQGGCCIIDPLGNFLVEPNRSGEVIRYAEIDLSATIRGKFNLDTVGHYSRPDIFELTVDERALPESNIIDCIEKAMESLMESTCLFFRQSTQEEATVTAERKCLHTFVTI